MLEKGIKVILATITLTVADKSDLQVFKKPRAAILATGDEIVLPGGPPFNLIGFVKLALPGLLKLGGHWILELPQRNVRLTASVQGPPGWLQAILGRLRSDREGRWNFQPDRQTSRL